MDLQRIFRLTRPIRGLPTFARYLLATLIVAVFLGLRSMSEPYLRGYPFLMFFPALILISVTLDRGTGIYAAVLSAVLAWYFFLPPVRSFAISNAAEVVVLVLYVGVGVFLAIVIEALRITADSLQKANAQLERADGFNRLLLLDVNHRVKNHLLSVTSLLRLSTKGISDARAKAAIEEAASRIDVLGKVYNRLHLGDRTTVVRSRDFIIPLVDELRAGVIGVRPIALRSYADEVEITSSQAVPIGLIINELIENALKHAFPDDRAGEIWVRFEREGERYCITVEDNGVGLPPDAAPGSGTKLVRSLAQQLGGELRQRNDGGASTAIAFPVELPTARRQG